MAFYGCEFGFDGIPCTEFGLMIYHFGSNAQSDVSFSIGDIYEDRINGRHDAILYGVSDNRPLEYTLVFGANMESMDANRSLDRFEVEAIAAWLTGHSERKWLHIIQEDMESFRYKCLVSDLKLITYGDYPWAFSCKVSCDSPYAYTFPETYALNVGSEPISYILRNRSTCGGYYKPQIQIESDGECSLSIVNYSDKGREFRFDYLPAGTPLIVDVDNHNQIIKSSDGSNLYPYFNYKFFRLVRGDNELSITTTGSATIRFCCEFPVNIGA